MTKHVLTRATGFLSEAIETNGLSLVSVRMFDLHKNTLVRMIAGG